MVSIGEFWSEIIVCVSGFSKACQEDDRAPFPSPIHDFKADTRLHLNELNARRRWCGLGQQHGQGWKQSPEPAIEQAHYSPLALRLSFIRVHFSRCGTPVAPGGGYF